MGLVSWCRLASPSKLKPSAVTLPTIFNPLAITVRGCFDANIVTSYPELV